MGGLVACAMAGARRGRGFEPRLVCPSRGPPVRSPPPPPSASLSTIGTAGGRVACLVLVFLPPSMTPRLLKTRQQTQHTCSSALRHRYRCPPGGAFPPRIPLPLACGRGIELGSSGLQPAAQPLQYAARNSSAGPTTLTQHLGCTSACLNSQLEDRRCVCAKPTHQ